MMKKAIRTLSMFALFVLAATLLLSSWTFADTINLSLSAPVQSGTAGSTVSFDATVSASGKNSETIFMNGDGFNVPSTLVMDDSAFFNNFFPLSLDPGDSFTDTLFSVVLPSDLTAGSYTGSFTILGGSDMFAQDTLGTVDWTVDVAPTASTVPEPGSLMLLVSGLPGVAVLVQRRWRGSSDNKA
jgi:hypothetical protein